MAFANLRKELVCSICLNIYTDPVNLKCGHNFCQVCISCVLDTQERTGVYSCPECRTVHHKRPELQRNFTLRNIVTNLGSSEINWPETGTYCTYCIEAPVPAVVYCLLCEASLCHNHLKVHSKSSEHTLSDLSTFQKNKKHSIHDKILECYCTKDDTFMCGFCKVNGAHQGHNVKSLYESFDKKDTLINGIHKFFTERKELEVRIQSLLKHKRTILEKAISERKSFTALFKDFWGQLEELEKKDLLSEISRQEEKLSSQVSDLIRQLEIRMKNMAGKILYPKELYNLTDPQMTLQESSKSYLRDAEEGDIEDRETQAMHILDRDDLDLTGISHILHKGLSDLIFGINGGICMQGAADILLDINTAHNELYISEDRKTAIRSPHKSRTETPERFMDYPQVLSSGSFSSGQCFWDVDIEGSECWIVGMCYPSINRAGVFQSAIGLNKKSWCLYRDGHCHFVIHDTKVTRLHDNISSDRIRVYLDCEAGQISFYELGLSIHHLHTFSDTFAEPLHAALGVWGSGCIKVSGGNLKV
uniref:Uncharacterized protein n=1 Tax=Pyxicephalus adspersus TaxID=30357 RepID=A0AAV3AD66_PYXAD|nr:TPA: hypothetical protein GDO54_009995 [Pyxicephalus adspersus]